MLDKYQNAIIVVDENGNMNLSDDEIFKISTTANLNEKKVDLDLPVKLYNASTNSVKDSLVSLEMQIAFKSETPKSVEDVIIRFSNRKSLTAEIASENFKYIFSWVPLLSANRKYLGSDLPLRIDIMDKKDSLISFKYQNIGDTMIIDNYRTIIKQYNGDQLLLQTDTKEIEGYQLGQLFRPAIGIDIFNPDKKIDISSKKYLVLDFWGTWCAPCIAAMPELVALEEKYKKKADLISIVSDYKNNMELAKKIIKKQKLIWPQIWDERTNSSLTNALQIQFFPTMIVVNKQREIVFITTKIESLKSFLEKAH